MIKPAEPLTVRDVLTTPAVVVTPEITCAEIAHRFLSSDLGGMFRLTSMTGSMWLLDACSNTHSVDSQ